MSPARARLTAPIVLLMSVATGLAVASNYYAQPLLHTIGAEFALTTATAGAIVTVAQLSYAVGLILLVPLGDLYERRTLIALMTALSAVGLLLSAFSPGIGWLMLGTAVTGLLSVVAQVLVPFAATLAEPHERGKVVGAVMSGLLLGILLARTIAGALADLGSWRTVYWVAAILMLLMSMALWRVLPRSVNPTRLSYPRLLASIVQLYAQEPLLRARSVLGALLFAAFSMLWTPLTFLLSGPNYGYSNTTIGLFGLAGAIGAYGANRFGRLNDRGQGNRSTRQGLLLLASWPLLAWGAHHVAPLLAGVLALDLAIQAVHVTNQSAIYRLRPEARSRLTAGYMTSYFLGGALTSLAALLYGCLARSARIPETTPAPAIA
ncbi:transmembrane transport protein [Bordetella pertussis]|uniref:MFS permease protein / putative transmembrane transport protein n=1 Tax=Bordetella pertussis (strain ATCC 9797 / DSM 5571 / CCUG 30873 / LMG 14455 / NCTC 10739 / 18323) TaxID=568706 RepID=A0A0T7CQ25_BORP1|nr:MFS transporter [Bordetella pertussis]AZR85233.1 transporter [Bordetella pertussis]PNO98082.1 MFS transporter [Bordetella pertussis 18323]UEB58423.1 MFS transporter [Bordetella pertussis]CCJ63641.1 MFS permease protein / putative transmembrane transport protein [Bordetella pertussis 18323]CFP47522.1 transmembrane transport protein [Bordetella pertussis]